MHSDEQRPVDLLKRQIADELKSRGPVSHTDYIDMAERTERAQSERAQYRQEAERLRAELRAAKNKLKKLEQNKAEMKVRLVSSEGSLNAYRRENKKLKETLRSVRDSRTMRIGKAVTRPFRPIITPPVKSHDDADSSNSNDSAETTQIALPASTPTATTEPKALDPANLSLGQQETEALIERFIEAPDAVQFGAVLNRLWFNEGDLERSRTLVEEYEDLVQDLSAPHKNLVTRIEGALRLWDELPVVPSRPHGAAYQVEPGRILYCVHSTPTFNSNGYSTRTGGIAKGMAEAGKDVVVASRSGYPWDSSVDVEMPPAERTVIKLDSIPYVNRPGASLSDTPMDRYMIEAADAFVREARLQRPEVIQSASNHLTALPALVAARRLGVPFIYEVRGLWELSEAAKKEGWEKTDRFRLAVKLETLVATEADRVLAITPQLADELVNRGVDPARIDIVPNAVNTTDFVPLPCDQEYANNFGIRTDVPVVGYAGSLVGYEGIDDLIQASKLLHDRGVDHQVVIAGSGSEAKALRRVRDGLELPTVTFIGRRPIAEMPRLMSSFDIVACPRKREPVTEMVSPLKPLEAFASAKAVILSDVAPHVDLAGEEDDRRALLFPASDVTALADAIQRLCNDLDERNVLRRNGRLWAIRERQWAKIGETISESIVQAKQFSAQNTVSDQRLLSDVNVALIADEFTTRTLSACVAVTPLARENWRNQIAEQDFDVLLVESAWMGNEGTWHRGVGHYSESESEDLFSLIDECRARKITTVFWNKEDPVHYRRFAPTAARFDYVFTTDADRIQPYLEQALPELRAVASLPFYAEPSLHNPLDEGLAFEKSSAHAGSFYGDRYAERSAQLVNMLEAAIPDGLTIYDRQANDPESPYRFPYDYQEYVRGSLPYTTLLGKYKTHISHLNVNSVVDSPTMFSRRVVEIAASGGVVLSGPGRGIAETLGETFPVTDSAPEYRAMIHSWAHDAEQRAEEAWRQMRTVYRAHTTATAITLLMRTARIPVVAPVPDTYMLKLHSPGEELIDSIAAQSYLPSKVLITGESNEAGRSRLEHVGIDVVHEMDSGAGIDWCSEPTQPLSRTHYEDLLIATKFGDWQGITYRKITCEDEPSTLAYTDENPQEVPTDSLFRGDNTSRDDGAWLVWTIPSGKSYDVTTVQDDKSDEAQDSGPKTILFAGHDFKFLTPLIEEVRSQGHKVLLDHWQSHTAHDEQQSFELLSQADVVFCEWGLGNAVWYSEHKRRDQRLVVRIHLQEIDLPYLRATTHEAVDAYIFVGELIRRAAVESHDVPAERALVVPNMVNIDELDLPKTPDARFNLGLVGVVPQRKRMDLAITLLEKLLEVDSRYKLFFKGKTASDYPWMKNRPEELAYYDEQDRRIEVLNEKYPGAVTFDPHGNDMAEWFRKIGVALSTSDFESFHLTIADGAASAAKPASLAWDGADLIYPDEWLHGHLDSMAREIVAESGDAKRYKDFVSEAFDVDLVMKRLIHIIEGIV